MSLEPRKRLIMMSLNPCMNEYRYIVCFFVYMCRSFAEEKGKSIRCLRHVNHSRKIVAFLFFKVSSLKVRMPARATRLKNFTKKALPSSIGVSEQFVGLQSSYCLPARLDKRFHSESSARISGVTYLKIHEFSICHQ